MNFNLHSLGKLAKNLPPFPQLHFYVIACKHLVFLQFIVLFVAKVLTGQMKEVNDVREYEEDELKERTDTNDQMSTEG